MRHNIVTEHDSENNFVADSKHIKLGLKVMVTCRDLEVSTSHGNICNLSTFGPFLSTKQKKICRYLSCQNRVYIPQSLLEEKKLLSIPRLTMLVRCNMILKDSYPDLKVGTKQSVISRDSKVDTSHGNILEVLK